MDRTPPFIRVVVLAFDGADMTLECLGSILGSNWPADRFEVVLVDNGSIDDVVSRVRDRYSRVRLIEPLRNLGFAGGCNAGITAVECSLGRALSPFDFVALVNNDATVHPDWLVALVETMYSDEHIGAASPKMLFAPKFQEIEVSQFDPDDPNCVGEPVCITAARIDGRRADDRFSFDEGFGGPSEFSPSAGEEFARWSTRGGRVRIDMTESTGAQRVSLRIGARVPGVVRIRTDSEEHEVRIGAAAARSGLLGQFVECEISGEGFDVVNNAGSALYKGGSAGDRGFLERDRGQFDESAEVFAWCGGAVLLRKEYLDDVGLFDESLFLYYEDTDLSWRGRLLGWRYVYTPKAIVRHRHAQSSVAGSPLFRFQVERNRLLVLVKNAPGRVASRAVLGQIRGFTRAIVQDVVSPGSRLKLPRLTEVRLRWKVLRSFFTLLPHAMRARWALDTNISRRRVMSLAVEKVVPIPVFDESTALVSSSASRASQDSKPTAAIFNLHWQTLGGGEVVGGEIARVLGEDHDVTLLGPSEPDGAKFADRLGIDISKFAWRRTTSDIEASRASADFDVFVNCTYSSRAVNRAPIGLYYVHFPRALVPRAKELAVQSGVRLVRLAAKLPVRTTKFATAERVFRTRLEDDSWARTYTRFIANSRYTQDWIRRIWDCDSEVVHPPVRNRVEGDSKAHSIVSIGRFFDPDLGHSKKQMEMLTAFADMVRSHLGAGDWRLALIGGADSVSRDFVMRIRRAARDLPIDVLVNAKREVIDDALAHASIYWHASGYGEDELHHPERLEHFGIAVVEAMAAGVVPVVYGAGGPVEIVRHGIDGFHWHTLEQLAQFTRRLMNDESLRAEMSESARKRASEYSPSVFDDRLRLLIASLGGSIQTK